MTNNETTHRSTATLTADDPRAVYARAWDIATDAAAAVRTDQAGDPTPCTEYAVADLLGHLISVGRRVACLGRGLDAFSVPEVSDDVAPGAWSAAFTRIGTEFEEAWRDDATLDLTITLPWADLSGAEALAMYANEVSVHTWDLAVATGQTPCWDDSVLAVALAAMEIGLPAEGRVEQFEAVRQNMPAGFEDFTPPFAAAVEAADDAPLIDRLVAWNGRRPSWPA